MYIYKYHFMNSFSIAFNVLIIHEYLSWITVSYVDQLTSKLIPRGLPMFDNTTRLNQTSFLLFITVGNCSRPR